MFQAIEIYEIEEINIMLLFKFLQYVFQIINAKIRIKKRNWL